jgi:PPE-repeat protein
MEFNSLPPEVTSALMHSGPGAESLLQASAAWRLLGTELEESAGAYIPVMASLVGVWNGPASTTMTTAVATYLTWVRSTAQQALQLGSAAQLAAAAFSTTLAAVVPPSVVAANRLRLAQLQATNGVGTNLAAIAATESQYQEMWVDNASALYRYQAASAQALELPMFVAPPSIADPAGTTAQANAVQTAAATATSSSTLNNLTSALTGATALPADAVPPPVSPLDAVLQAIGVTFDPQQGWFGLANTYANQFLSSGFPINMLSYFAQTTSAQALQAAAPDIFQGLSEGESAFSGVAGGLTGAVGSLAGPEAAMGAAISVGNLSAPPAATAVLTAAHSPVQLASAATPLPPGDAGAGDFNMLPPLMPPPISGAGSGWKKRKEQKYEDLAMGLELKGNFVPRPPSAG